jgi:hypothetical protein
VKRKLITRWRVIAALVIVLTIAASAIYAALTITEAEITGASCQQWTLVAESLLVSGTAMDVSDGYAKTLLIEWGYVEADDSAGAQMDVEISEDGGNWILLTSFMTTADATVGADDVNDLTSLAGDAYLILTDMVTDEFDVVNRQWIVYDNADHNVRNCSHKKRCCTRYGYSMCRNGTQPCRYYNCLRPGRNDSRAYPRNCGVGSCELLQFRCHVQDHLRSQTYKDHRNLTMKRILLIFVLASTCWGQFNGTKPILGEQIDWSHPLARGLVGFWLMNENSGSWVNDLSGNGNHGTITTMTWRGNAEGATLDTDTVGYVEVPHSSVLNVPSNQNATWVIRFKAATTATSRGLFGKWLSSATKRSWGINVRSDNDLSLYISSDGSAIEEQSWTNSNLTDDQWYTAAVVYHAPTADLYLNGQYVQTVTHTVQTTCYAGIGQVFIGKGATTSYDGEISWVNLYNRALSATEIARLYYDSFCMMVQERPELYVAAEAPAGGGQFIMVSRAAVPFLIPLGVIVSMAWCMRKRTAA